VQGDTAEDKLGIKLGKTTDPEQLAQSLLADVQNLQQAKSKDPGMKEQVDSTGGLVAALAAIGAAAAGRPEAGGGLLSGFLDQAEQKVALEQRTKEKEVEQLSDDIASKRAALNQVFQANPESFLDEGGKQTIDETMLGYALTGRPIAISAASRVAIDRRGRTYEHQMKAIHAAFNNAQTPAGRERALRLWADAGGFSWDDEVFADMAASPDMNSFLLKLMHHADVNTVLDASLFAAREGIDNVNHERFPEVMEYIAPKLDDDSTAKIPEKWETAATLVTQWVMQDPRNRLSLDPQRQAEMALNDRPDLLAEWQKRYGDVFSEDLPVSGEELFGHYMTAALRMLATGNFNEDLVQKLTDPDFVERFIGEAVDSSVKNVLKINNVKKAQFMNDLEATALKIMIAEDVEYTPDNMEKIENKIINLYATQTDIGEATRIIAELVAEMAKPDQPADVEPPLAPEAK
jgi:hypothetical protein